MLVKYGKNVLPCVCWQAFKMFLSYQNTKAQILNQQTMQVWYTAFTPAPVFTHWV